MSELPVGDPPSAYPHRAVGLTPAEAVTASDAPVPAGAGDERAEVRAALARLQADFGNRHDVPVGASTSAKEQAMNDTTGRATETLDQYAKDAGQVAPGLIPDWLLRVAASVRELWIDEPATVVMDESGVGDGMATCDELELIASALQYSLEAAEVRVRETVPRLPEPLPVVECPSCGASIRARMADSEDDAIRPQVLTEDWVPPWLPNPDADDETTEWTIATADGSRAWDFMRHRWYEAVDQAHGRPVYVISGQGGAG